MVINTVDPSGQITYRENPVDYSIILNNQNEILNGSNPLEIIIYRENNISELWRLYPGDSLCWQGRYLLMAED